MSERYEYEEESKIQISEELILIGRFVKSENLLS